MKRPQHFVARNRVNPNASLVHLGKHLGGWAALHGKARLQTIGSDALDFRNPLAQGSGVIKPEGGSNFFS